MLTFVFVVMVQGARPPTAEILSYHEEALAWVQDQLATHPGYNSDWNPRTHLDYAWLIEAEKALETGIAGWQLQDQRDATGYPKQYWETHDGTGTRFCDESLYVRKEIRELADDERTRFFNALHVMGTVSGDDGRATYGDKFLTMGEAAAYHLASVHTPPCDSTHVFGGFLPWHKTYVLRIEQSVWAVDPLAPPAPYYDVARDVTEYGLEDLASSPVWQDGMLGTIDGDPLNGFQVPDLFGLGPYPLPTNDTDPAAKTLSEFTNAAGILRNPDNPLSTPYIARMPFWVEDQDISKNTRVTPVSQGLETLLLNETDPIAAYRIINGPIVGLHTLLHFVLGGYVVPDTNGLIQSDEGYDFQGVYGPQHGDVVSDECATTCAALMSDCSAFETCANITDGCECPACTHCNSTNTTSAFGPTWWATAPLAIRGGQTVVGVGASPTALGSGCVLAATCATNGKPTWDHECLSVIQPENCNFPTFLAPFYQLPGQTGSLYGDLTDHAGPSDPVFVLIHSNVDRLFHEWQAQQIDRGVYEFDSDAGYDDLGTMAPPICTTHQADSTMFIMPDNDYLNWSTVFHDIYDGIEGQPVNRDTMMLANLPYTYNTICPTPVPTAAPEQPIVPDSKKQKSASNLGLMIGVGAALGVLVLVIVGVLFKMISPPPAKAVPVEEA